MVAQTLGGPEAASNNGLKCLAWGVPKAQCRVTCCGAHPSHAGVVD